MTNFKVKKKHCLVLKVQSKNLMYFQNYEVNLHLCKLASKKCRDNSEEVTPVPIPNTVVKLFSADGTWLEAAWESRTSPVFLLSFFFSYIAPCLSMYS